MTDFRLILPDHTTYANNLGVLASSTTSTNQNKIEDCTYSMLLTTYLSYPFYCYPQIRPQWTTHQRRLPIHHTVVLRTGVVTEATVTTSTKDWENTTRAGHCVPRLVLTWRPSIVPMRTTSSCLIRTKVRGLFISIW